MNVDDGNVVFLRRHDYDHDKFDDDDGEIQFSYAGP